MQLVTIPKTEHAKILKNQEYLKSEVLALKKRVLFSRPVQEDAIRPEVIRRIERRSKAMDKGAGTRLKSIDEIKKFFRDL